MDKNIYDILIENATNEYMDNILLHDTEYKEILIIDRLISTCISSGCCYGRIAYQQGIRDCALLLRKMKLIK